MKAVWDNEGNRWLAECEECGSTYLSNVKECATCVVAKSKQCYCDYGTKCSMLKDEEVTDAMVKAAEHCAKTLSGKLWRHKENVRVEKFYNTPAEPCKCGKLIKPDAIGYYSTGYYVHVTPKTNKEHGWTWYDICYKGKDKGKNK